MKARRVAPPRPGLERFQAEKLQRFDAGWHSQTLSNGLRLLYHPNPESPEFYLGTVIQVGARLENPKERGLSHFLEHMMFRGSKSYPSFLSLAEAFEWHGGEWNAATGYEHTEYWYSGIHSGAEDVVPLFAEFLQEPLLLDIDLERQVIVREIEGELNEFGHSTDLDLHVAGEFWQGSALADPIFGDQSILADLHLDHLKNHLRHYYYPENMVVWVVGGAQNKAILPAVERYFGAWQPNRQLIQKPELVPVTPAQDGPHIKHVENSDNEFDIQLSFQTAGEWSEEVYAYEIICRILSDGFCSRLVRRLREEEGLVYDIDADASQHYDVGTIDIDAAITPEKAEHFFQELFQTLAKFVQDGPTEDEIKRAMIRSLVDLELAPAAPEEIATQLAWAQLTGHKTSLMADREAILKLSADDICQYARRIMRKENGTLIIFGPKNPGLVARAEELLRQYL